MTKPIADYVFNPWREREGNRIVASESMWKQPLKWDREAARRIKTSRSQEWPDPPRPRVFCASLADVFESWDGPMLNAKGEQLFNDDDGHIPTTMQDIRNRLFKLVDATPNLDWLVLTKRPENIAAMMPRRIVHDSQPIFPGAPGKLGEPLPCIVEGGIRPNLFLGTSVENQQAADERIPHLLKTPAAVRFLSVEPLLGPVDIEPFLQYEPFHENYKMTFGLNEWRGVDWVIVGGESGPQARPCNVAWIRSIVEQCKAAGAPVFCKQLGKRPECGHESGLDQSKISRILGSKAKCMKCGFVYPKDDKGGDIEEFPADLQVREFPKV